MEPRVAVGDCDWVALLSLPPPPPQAASAAARVAVSPEHGYGDISARALGELPGAWKDGAKVTLGGSTGGDPRWGDPDAEVTVEVHTPTFIPGVDRLFGDALAATATAQMRFEGRLP